MKCITFRLWARLNCDKKLGRLLVFRQTNLYLLIYLHSEAIVYFSTQLKKFNLSSPFARYDESLFFIFLDYLIK